MRVSTNLAQFALDFLCGPEDVAPSPGRTIHANGGFCLAQVWEEFTDGAISAAGRYVPSSCHSSVFAARAKIALLGAIPSCEFAGGAAGAFPLISDRREVPARAGNARLIPFIVYYSVLALFAARAVREPRRLCRWTWVAGFPVAFRGVVREDLAIVAVAGVVVESYRSHVYKILARRAF